MVAGGDDASRRLRCLKFVRYGGGGGGGACVFRRSRSRLCGGDFCILNGVGVVVCNPPCCSLGVVVVGGGCFCSCGNPGNRTVRVVICCSSRHHSACVGCSKPCCNPVTSAAVVVVVMVVDCLDMYRACHDGNRV